MTREELVSQIKTKKSMLCVGLDTDMERIPRFLLDYEDPILEFNRRIIEATKHVAVAYKPNTAFYEAQGEKGWERLARTAEMIPDECLSIADAKRGDIGNTAKQYAKAFYEEMGYDALTVNPYMGEDSVTPFLEYEDKWTIVLGLTSNKGSQDLQTHGMDNGSIVFEHMIRNIVEWGNEKTMLVVGATQGDRLMRIRDLAPSNFLLVPGVGAQGGDLEEVCRTCTTDDGGLLINSTRGIIYASGEEDFDQVAKKEAETLASQMSSFVTS